MWRWIQRPRSGDGVRRISEFIDGIEYQARLGPDLLEGSYEACLAYELAKPGLRFRFRFHFCRRMTGRRCWISGTVIDILVEEEIVIELKAVDALAPVHKAQLLSYLRHSGKRVGLLINFNVERLKDGIVRRINGYEAKRDEHGELGGGTELHRED